MLLETGNCGNEPGCLESYRSGWGDRIFMDVACIPHSTWTLSASHSFPGDKYPDDLFFSHILNNVNGWTAIQRRIREDGVHGALGFFLWQGRRLIVYSNPLVLFFFNGINSKAVGIVLTDLFQAYRSNVRGAISRHITVILF